MTIANTVTRSSNRIAGGRLWFRAGGLLMESANKPQQEADGRSEDRGDSELGPEVVRPENAGDDPYGGAEGEHPDEQPHKVRALFASAAHLPLPPEPESDHGDGSEGEDDPHRRPKRRVARAARVFAARAREREGCHGQPHSLRSTRRARRLRFSWTPSPASDSEHCPATRSSGAPVSHGPDPRSACSISPWD